MHNKLLKFRKCNKMNSNKLVVSQETCLARYRRSRKIAQGEHRKGQEMETQLPNRATEVDQG